MMAVATSDGGTPEPLASPQASIDGPLAQMPAKARLPFGSDCCT